MLTGCLVGLVMFGWVTVASLLLCLGWFLGLHAEVFALHLLLCLWVACELFASV